MRPGIPTVSGAFFDFLEPSRSVFGIEDIAYSLSNLCRFTGHVRPFYSVAQHSVIVSRIVPPEHALAGLLHDSAEAFIGDVSRPLKALLPDYRAIEKRVEAVVFRKFGLSAELPQSIKIADAILRATELRDLMWQIEEAWKEKTAAEPLPETIKALPSEDAYKLFMERFIEIMRQSAKGLAA